MVNKLLYSLIPHFTSKWTELSCIIIAKWIIVCDLFSIFLNSNTSLQYPSFVTYYSFRPAHNGTFAILCRPIEHGIFLPFSLSLCSIFPLHRRNPSARLPSLIRRPISSYHFSGMDFSPQFAPSSIPNENPNFDPLKILETPPPFGSDTEPLNVLNGRRRTPLLKPPFRVHLWNLGKKNSYEAGGGLMRRHDGWHRWKCMW